MATLNELAQDLAATVGKPTDKVLISRYKELILQERALFYRRAIDKDGIDASFKHRYIIELKEVDSNKTAVITAGTNILRTLNKVPNPVRYKTSVPFIYVGTVSGSKPYVNSENWEAEYLSNLPVIGSSSNVVRYSYVNKYIYVHKELTTTGVIEYIAVEAVYENPMLSYNREDNESGIYYEDDMEFPIPYDFLVDLKRSLLTNRRPGYEYRGSGYKRDEPDNPVEA